MKKYSLVTRWVSDQPDIQCNFDTLEELLRDPIVKSAIDTPHFHRLSVQNEYLTCYPMRSYSMFTFIAEYHDGYVYKKLGHLIRYPIDQLNIGFPAEANICPANCVDFNPAEELGIFSFNYYNWIVYKLVGNSGAFVVEELIKENFGIDIIKKFIEDEIKHQLTHPPKYPQNWGPKINLPFYFK